MPGEPLRLVCVETVSGLRRYKETDPELTADYLAWPANDPDTAAHLAGPELYAELLLAEWSDGRCDRCGGIHPAWWSAELHKSLELRGHDSDCPRDAALARARGEVEP